MNSGQLVHVLPCVLVLTLGACSDEAANQADVAPRASVDARASLQHEAAADAPPADRSPASGDRQTAGGGIDVPAAALSTQAEDTAGLVSRPTASPKAMPPRSGSVGATPSSSPRLMSGRELRARSIEEKRATALFPRPPVTPDPDQVDVVPMLNLNGAVVPEALITDLVPGADPRLLLPEEIQGAPPPRQEPAAAADISAGASPAADGPPAPRRPTFEEIVAGNVPDFCPPPEAAWTDQPVNGFYNEQFAYIGCMGFD
jgi:hypothetical protein